MGDTKSSNNLADLAADERRLVEMLRQFRASRAAQREAHKDVPGVTEVCLVVQAFVLDHKKLGAYAFQRYEACGGEARDFRKHRGDVAWQLLQALVLSNENPPTEDFGVEIGVCTEGITK